MNLARRVGFVALALAGLMTPLLVSQARADIKFKDKGIAAVGVNNCTATNNGNGTTTVATSGPGNNFNQVQCGDVVTGAGVPVNTTVQSLNPISGTSLTVSNGFTVGAGTTFTFTGTRVTSTMKFTIETIPNLNGCGPIMDEILGPCNGYQIVHFCVGNTFPDAVMGVAQYDPAAKIATPLAFVFGNASAGGENQIETLPDSLVAGVGLYKAPGGTANVPPPGGTGSPDSALRVNVGRSGTTVTLTVPTIVVGGVSVGSGGMQVRAANSNETSIAEMRLIVYADSNAANADVNTDGFGSSFFGRVVLEAGVGVPTGVSTLGGFTNNDFILQPQPGSKYTLRPIAGLTKNVTVPNANNAVVVMVADPRTVSRPVPGPAHTPLGLALLALALMGSGLWVMQRRRSAPIV